MNRIGSASSSRSYLQSKQRDFELIRNLLILFREKGGPEAVTDPDVGEECNPNMVRYHLA